MTTITFRDLNSGQGAASPVYSSPSPALLNLIRLRALLLVWAQRARQRRQLAELSDRQLDDVGISRSEAMDEARKPFWRS